LTQIFVVVEIDMNEPQSGASCAHESGYCHIWSMSCFMRRRKRPSQHSADLFGWLLLVNELLYGEEKETQST